MFFIRILYEKKGPQRLLVYIDSSLKQRERKRDREGGWGGGRKTKKGGGGEGKGSRIKRARER